MRRRVIVFFSLVSLFVFFFLFSSIPVLEIRAADSGAMLYCAPVSSDEEIFYRSINSMYQVPVAERWRVHEDGALGVVDVVSSPAVMEYYRLDDYASAGNGQYRAIAREASYREVRIKVDARGEEKLIVRGKEIPLDELVPEASVIRISVENRARVLACF